MTRLEFVDDKGKKTKSVDIPASWDEMTALQVQYAFQKYDDLVSGKIDCIQFQVLVLYYMLGIRGLPSAKIARLNRPKESVAYICREHLGYLLLSYDDGRPPQLAFRSVQNPLPAVRGKALTLTGPAALCQDLTFGEYRHAASALNTFFASGNLSDLEECIAHLYRPRTSRANSAGRKVKPVNPDTFEREREAVRSIPAWQKNLIMMWFASCIGYLQTGKLTLDGEEVDFKQLYSGGSSKGPAYTLNDVLFQTAKDGILGDADAVDAAPLMVVLSTIWHNYKEYKRHEQTRKAAKGK